MFAISQSPALPAASRILVTGANGYIASNIVDLLLELGYNVRGSVRESKPWLDGLFEQKYGAGRFETVVLASLQQPEGLDKAMQDIAGVIHVASDVSFSTDPLLVIRPVVDITKNMLRAANRHPSVKRVVLTSSSTAALIPTVNRRVTVTEATWNDAVVAAAWDCNTPEDQKGYIVYAASKTEAEREAWKWVRDTKPRFVFNTVLPNMTYGRILSAEIPASTMGWTRKLLLGDNFATKVLPPQWFVDVQDVARLHVIALLATEVKHDRLFAFAAPLNWTDVITTLRKLRPAKTIPDPPENEGRDLSDIKPSRRAEDLIRKYFQREGWTSLEQSLSDGIADIE